MSTTLSLKNADYSTEDDVIYRFKQWFFEYIRNNPQNQIDQFTRETAEQKILEYWKDAIYSSIDVTVINGALEIKPRTTIVSEVTNPRFYDDVRSALWLAKRLINVDVKATWESFQIDFDAYASKNELSDIVKRLQSDYPAVYEKVKSKLRTPLLAPLFGEEHDSKSPVALFSKSLQGHQLAKMLDEIQPQSKSSKSLGTFPIQQDIKSEDLPQITTSIPEPVQVEEPSQSTTEAISAPPPPSPARFPSLKWILPIFLALLAYQTRSHISKFFK